MNRTVLLFAGIALALPVFALPACCPTPNTNALYVAFGDSLTQGKDSPTYPSVLAGLLGIPSDRIANEGKSGESANDGLDRIRQFFVDCDTFPNAHTLLYWQGAAGLIDWILETDRFLLFDPLSPSYPYAAQLEERLTNIQNNVVAAVEMAAGSVDAVYVADFFDLLPWISPCDTFGAPLAPGLTVKANNYIQLLNEKIHEAVSDTGVTLVNIHGELGALHNDPANFIDCNHPSGAGNELIAGVFLQALTGP